MGVAAKWDVKTVSVQGGVKEDIWKMEAAIEDGWELVAVTRNGVMLEYHFKRAIEELPDLEEVRQAVINNLNPWGSGSYDS